MRISDWSADVDSSDLRGPGSRAPPRPSGCSGGSSAWSARRGRRSYSLRLAWGSSFRGLLAVLVVAPAQRADELQLRLEVDVVRPLQVLHEAGGLDVVGVIEHELLVLRRVVHRPIGRASVREKGC